MRQRAMSGRGQAYTWVRTSGRCDDVAPRGRRSPETACLPWTFAPAGLHTGERLIFLEGESMKPLLVLLALLTSHAVSAQLLDFDSVCASPPCSVGTRYAPSGVSFTPNTSSIVAAGTNGLNGPVGGVRYLSIAAFPYQTSITLARQATFFAMQLSRASTSSGTVTVAVTWLKAGVPVSNQNVVLTTVNTWSVASASVPGGFDSIFIDASGGANLTFGIDGIQFGGTCYGFADVQPADSFCNASEWLANRGVTLGCVAGQYCPTQNVTRAQMALFMNRLGNALVPRILKVEDSLSSTFSPGAFLCRIELEVAPYPRIAWVVSTNRLVGFSGPKTVGFRIHHSTDGGVNWVGSDGFFMDGSGTTGDRRVVAENAVVALAAGIRHAVSVRAQSQTDTNPLQNDCELFVLSLPAVSGATAPFDSRPGPQQAGGASP